MGKFLLELALFAGILCQIHTLAARAHHPQASPSVPVSTHQEAWLSMQEEKPAPAPYASLPKDASPMALQNLAAQEAQRIIATGDIKSLQNELDKNQALLGIMGYNY